MTVSATGITTLQTVLEREQGLRDTATLALRDAQMREAQDDAQLSVLQSYRRETVKRWATPRCGPTSVQHLQTARGFLERLDEAIAQQLAACERARDLVALRRSELLEAERRVAALLKLIERRQHAQRAAALRSEQKATDEVAQRVRANDALLSIEHESCQGA